jgi:beta-glucosidase-like glycosyl hydrolase
MNCRDEDFDTLTEEQHATLLNGLKEGGLYQASKDQIHQRVMESQAAARLAEEATKTEEHKLADREIWAPYIDTLKNLFKFEPEWSQWGFVVFHATAYGTEHDAQWAEFHWRWDQIIEEEHTDQRGFHPKSDREIELLRFLWVEDPLLEGASSVDVSR